MKLNFRLMLRQILAYAICWSMILSGQVYAVTGTDIASEPLSQPASNIPPNIMMLFDDSGSMMQQFTPDYIGRYSSASASEKNRLCFDSLDSSTNITGSLLDCEAGDVPLMSPDINTQYYSPDIRYQPAVNYDGTEKNSMTCANTGGTVSSGYCTNGWTAVPTDNVSPSTTNTFRDTINNMMEPGTVSSTNPATAAATTQNLVASFPDRVWCTSQGATVTDTAACLTNSGWAYPDTVNGYGWSTGTSGKSNVKYRSGSPYYYRLATTEYCTDANFTTCVASTVPTTVGATAYNFPAKVRYCTSSALTSCQAKYSGSYTYPKYAGNVAAAVTAVTGVAAKATITVPAQSDSAAGSITAINVLNASGTFVADLLTGTGTCGSISQGASFTPANAATAINSKIFSCVSSPDFTSAMNGTTAVDVTAPSTGTTYNGYTIQVVSSVSSRTPASFTLTISAVTKASSGGSMAKLTTFTVATSPSVNFLSTSGTINCSTANCNSNTTLTRLNEFASLINTGVASAVTAAGWTKSYTAGTGGGGTVNPVITFTAPTTTGAELNNTTVTATVSNATRALSNSSKLAGGTNNGDIETTVTSFSGGVTAVASVPATRANVGTFSRTNISTSSYCTTAARTTCVAQTTPTPTYPNSTYKFAQTTFSKASGRGDCTTESNICTYEEEMTNFANWFAYYRSRSQMAKTAIGRAFVNLSSNFRVGFITIAPFDAAPDTTTSVINAASGTTSQPSRFVPITAFNATQKAAWYSTLYGTERNNQSTPNKTALARVGMYYGNKAPNNMGASPITYSCQSNYAVLVTDGYWNDSVNPWRLDGSQIGNTDFSLVTTPRPQYDGTGTATVVTTTVSGTHSLGALGGNSCISTQRKVLLTTTTSTRTQVYASGNQTSDNTVTPAGVVTTVGACAAAPTLPADPATTVTVSTTTNGSTNTLADVAAYYYNTDLRPDMADEVPDVGTDKADHQHMTTFTVGLGLAGTLNYDPGYLSQTTGDYKSITQGTLNWPVPASNAETALDDTWHAAVNGYGQFFSAKDPAELTQSLTDTLSSVASRVGAGAAAATSNLQPVAGDNFAFTAQYATVEWTGDLTARTIDLTDGTVSKVALWSAATQLDLRTHLNRNIYTFDATDTTVVSGVSNGNKLKSFCWAGVDTSIYTTCTDGSGLTATELDYFDSLSLTQSLGWVSDGSGRNDATVATKAKLVDFLRGERANEIGPLPATTAHLFRKREHLLGDIISGQPAYVRAAPFNYGSTSDPYYSEFKADTDGTTASRKGTVYVAANDGMLHAFETDPDNVPYYQDAGVNTNTTSDDHYTGTLSTNPITGEGAERWAYIPTMVLPNLKRLADSPYVHQYFVDGSPAVGDICFDHTTSVPCSAKSKWHTILVGGLNAGGRGYYALDITDPDTPKGLWELKGGSDAASCLTDAQANAGTATSDCNIGYSFGNPLIVKRKSDGKWVVLLTSGYNNFSPGNGKGYLYIIEAQTGKILNRLSTGVGCDGVSTTSPCVSGTVDPSGLSRINAWVDYATDDNTALRIYGGDLKGNIWRFQLDPSGIGGTNAVHKVVTLTDSSGVAQPITTKPELATVQNYPVVYVTTGKLLGQTDKLLSPPPQTQSVYAIRDDLSNAAIVLRGGSGELQAQTLSAIAPVAPATTSTTRTTTSNSVDMGVKKGWYIDLPDTGERASVDPQLQLGTLVVPTNVPTSSDCTAGGYGWLNYFDYKSGQYVAGATANMASTKISAALIVGINVVQLPGGTVKTIVTTADNQQLPQSTPVSATAVTGRRVSWRELFVE